MENSMKAPQKNYTMWSNSSTSGYLSEKKKLIKKDICTCMFIMALFTIAKTWKQSSVFIHGWMDKKDVVHIHHEISLSHKKWYLIIFSTWMDLEGIMLSEINQRKTNMDALSLLLKKTLFIFFIFWFLIFWLWWVFIAAWGLFLVLASGGYSSAWFSGFAVWVSWSTVSRHTGFSSCSAWTQ